MSTAEPAPEPQPADLPDAVRAEAQAPLPQDLAGYRDALVEAADAHDVIRMDHLVFGWSRDRAGLEAREPQEHAMRAMLDRRLGQVLLGNGHPVAGQVLAEAIQSAEASGDVVEEMRCRLAFVPVEMAVGDEGAFDAGLGYVNQLLGMEEHSHAAGGMMGLAHVAPDVLAASLLLRASHLYEQADDPGWAAEACVLAVRALLATGDTRTADALDRARTLVEAHPTVELRISLAEMEALVLWQSGEPETAAVLLGEAIGAAERTGRPVPPDLRIMLCDLLVDTQQWQALRAPAEGLVQLGRSIDDDELTSMGERYLAQAR